MVNVINIINGLIFIIKLIYYIYIYIKNVFRVVIYNLYIIKI